MNLLGTEDNGDVILFDGEYYDNSNMNTSTQPVPYLDTYVGSNLITVGGNTGNTNMGQWTGGDFYNASANGGGSTVPLNSEPSWLDRLTSVYNDVAKNLQTGKNKTGSSQVDQTLAPLFGMTNPGPSNSNTNLANKALNSFATIMHQLNFGSPSGQQVPGVGVSQQKTNWTVGLILGAVALVVVFAALLRR
jgi:hypothetical protein